MSADGTIARLVADCDLVICAVPGFMGFKTLQQVIAAGRSVVDISFFPEDPFDLDELAKSRGVTAVVDCGVAPGLSNIIAGYADRELETLESFLCYVGGLPVIRRWPYEYKAVFSPIDVLEEYTRPARYVEHGHLVTQPALSGVELVNLPGVGTLEAFNTDGLRTLISTLGAPHMKEKTLRFPGHANLMAIFRDSGFFATAPLTIDGHQIRPLDVTSKLLFDHWRLREGEEDFTVMRVEIEGQTDEVTSVHWTFDLLDYYDRATQTTAMARTTGYTCAIVARQVLRGLFTQAGICPPEFVGRTPGCYADLVAELERRHIRLVKTVGPA